MPAHRNPNRKGCFRSTDPRPGLATRDGPGGSSASARRRRVAGSGVAPARQRPCSAAAAARSPDATRSGCASRRRRWRAVPRSRVRYRTAKPAAKGCRRASSAHQGSVQAVWPLFGQGERPTLSSSGTAGPTAVGCCAVGRIRRTHRLPPKPSLIAASQMFRGLQSSFCAAGEK